MNNSVGWFEIYVEDMDRAKAFYEAVFGVQLSRLDSPGMDMLAFPMQMENYGVPGALVKMPGFRSGGNSVLVYFSCADCATEAAKVLESGGKLHQEKTAIGEYGFMALAIDTEGNMIGLHSMQ